LEACRVEHMSGRVKGAQTGGGGKIFLHNPEGDNKALQWPRSPAD